VLREEPPGVTGGAGHGVARLGRGLRRFREIPREPHGNRQRGHEFEEQALSGHQCYPLNLPPTNHAAEGAPGRPLGSAPQRVLAGLLDGWAWLAGRRLTPAFYTSLLLIGVLVAVAAPHRIHRWAQDTFLFLDGGWRVWNGQRPYHDFYTGLGPVTFLLVALGFWFAGATPAGVDYGFGVAAMALGIWGWRLFQGRMERPAALLLALYVALLATAPHAMGARLDILTYASLYNRVGYALMLLVLVEAMCAPLAASARSEWAGGISSGAACALLLFLKPSFFLMAVAAAGASYIFRDLRSPRRTLGLVAGFAVPAMAIVAYLRFDVAAIWYDLRNVAAARIGAANIDPGTQVGLYAALKHFYDNVEELAGLLVLGWAVAILPRAPRAARYVDAWWPLAAAAAVFLMDVALDTANGVQYCLPLVGAFAAMLVSVMYLWWRSAGREERREYRWLCGFSLVLGMALFVPQALNDFATVVYSARQSLFGPPLAARFEAAPLRSLLSRETPADWDEPYDGKYLVDPINDGTALLESASRPTESVIALDSINPFSFALGRKPAEGGGPYLGATFFGPGHMPPMEWMIGRADLVMIPKNQTKAAAWLKQVFGEFVERNYGLAAESKDWLLYRRKAVGYLRFSHP